MKRRDIFRLFPLSATGLCTLSVNSRAGEHDDRPLCLRYLERVRDMLTKIRRSESDNLLEAA